MEPQITASSMKDALAQSRTYSDKADYVHARPLLHDALNSYVGTDRLQIATEYARVLRAQGYIAQALDMLLQEVEKLPGYLDETSETKWSIIRMKMEIYLLKISVTAEFDQSLKDAEDFRMQADDFTIIREFEPTAIEAALYYAKIRVLSCQFHDPVDPNQLESMISWLRPAFDNFICSNHYREAYRLIEAYGVFLGHSKRVGITCLDFHSWLMMVQTFISSTDLPLLKADAMALVARTADESLDLAAIIEMESNATRIYTDEAHLLGAADVRIHQISREIRKGPEHVTEDIIKELKGFFVKYEAADAVSAYHTALEAILPHIPNWLAPDLRLQLYHVSDELEAFSGATLFSHIGRVRLISLWVLHSGKAPRAAETAVAIYDSLGRGSCRWLRGTAAYLASLAYCQLQDFEKAEEWAAKSIKVFEGSFVIDRSQATSTLVQAKLELRRKGPSSISIEDFLSFVETAISYDTEHKCFEQAVLKMELVVGHTKELDDEQIRHWVEWMERTMKTSLQAGSLESDIRMAGLYQRQGGIFGSKLEQNASPEQWDQALDYFDKAVALYMKHKRLMEAANTRQMQSLVVFRRFQMSPSIELLSRCLELTEIALELFQQLDILTFVTSASQCISQFLYEGWQRRWLRSDDVLPALQKAESAWAMERADLTVFSSLEAVSRRQHLTSSGELRKVYLRASHICLVEGRIAELWSWTQRAKARSLSDQLGLDGKIPMDLHEKISESAAGRDLTRKAEEIWKQISESDPMIRLRLRGELDRVQSQMKSDPLLKLALDIRKGTPVELDQIRLLGEQMKKQSPNRDIIFIDWLEHLGDFWILVLNSKSELPVVKKCSLSVKEVTTWKQTWLDTIDGEPSAFEEDDYYDEDEPEFSLRSLDGLVAPLKEQSNPEDLFVFCPTGILHSIPLHALWIDNRTTVIERNPVIYSASLTTFWQCHRRAELASRLSPSQSMPWTMTGVFEPGSPAFHAAEQDKVYSTISSMTAKLNTRHATGSEVTRDFFSDALQQSSLFHFHGHCILDRKSVADQCLVLADGSLEMREVFDMKLRAPHITLIACESASQGIGAGDEPLGMVTALLCAGAGSVLGTIWPTASRTGRYFSEEFYEELASEMEGNSWDIVDLARVSRKAVLSLRRNMDTRQPYHWAAFVLYGSSSFKASFAP